MSRSNKSPSLLRLLLAYRAPAEDLAGVRTFVRKDEDREGKDLVEKPALPLGKRRDRRVPSTGGGSSEVRTVGYNTPDGGANLPQVKTLPQPGEERGTPYKDTALLTRRTMEGSFYREEKSPEDWGSKDEIGKLPQGGYDIPDTKGSPSKMLRPEFQPHSWPLDVSETHDAAGSAKVIPYDSGFENKKATTLADIQSGLSPAVVKRSQRYKPILLSVDTEEGSWTYKVGKWEVRVVADTPRPSRSTRLSLADLKITCSCPFWRWQGPEHWGKQEDYLDGDPRGTASVPVIRDPTHEHPICKHAYAVFSKMRNFKGRTGTTKAATAVVVAYHYLQGE